MRKFKLITAMILIVMLAIISSGDTAVPSWDMIWQLCLAVVVVIILLNESEGDDNSNTSMT